MRKDIEIPEVKGIYIVAVKEWDENFHSQDWLVHLINNSDSLLEVTIVVSRGSDADRKTATLRHGLGNIAPKSFKKIEMVTEEVLPFTNEFLVTFFIGEMLYEKTFVFPPHSISEKNIKKIPLLDGMEGVLGK